MAQDS